MQRGIIELLQSWPEDRPVLALLGTGRWQLLALDFDEVDPEEAWQSQLQSGALGLRSGTASGGPRPFFATGLFGLLSYDDCLRRQDALAPSAAPLAERRAGAPTRIFRVHRSLIWDSLNSEYFLARSRSELSAVAPAGVAAILGASLPASTTSLPPAGGIALIAQASAESYLAAARSALEDIRSGRYYQINLLRYFSLASEPTWPWLLARLAQVGGPFACLARVPHLTLASFSPERFVEAVPSTNAIITLGAEPIKGTAPRHADPEKDRASADRLLRSEKDHAELHMIVDLMRNDLQRISTPGTVAVPVPTRLDSYAHVHHLSARVTSRARPGLTLGELTAALCPAGSITGAPKREVMAAIRAYEGRPRGYFMGHAFYLDDGGRFDSSILIRTLVKEGMASFGYAAGSGIVAKSDPDAELREIDAKCAVVNR